MQQGGAIYSDGVLGMYIYIYIDRYNFVVVFKYKEGLPESGCRMRVAASVAARGSPPGPGCYPGTGRRERAALEAEPCPHAQTRADAGRAGSCRGEMLVEPLYGGVQMAYLFFLGGGAV